MENTHNQMTMWGGFLLFFLIFALIFRGGLFGAERVGEVAVGCNRVSNCDVERRGIIDSATTNYNILDSRNVISNLVSDEAAKTRMTVVEDGMKTREKIDFYEYDRLKTSLADSKANNIALQQELALTNKFNELNTANNVRFTLLERQLDQKPNAYPCYAPSASPCGQTFPTGCAS